MQITVFPTVFIALGGTGQSILHLFRQGLRQRIGTADIPFFRYLYIDTDTSSLQNADAGISGQAKQWTRTNLIDPSADTIKRIRNPREDNSAVYNALALEDWFYPYVNDQLGQTNYSQGVGGRRILSHLGFLSSRNLNELEQTLSGFYDELHGQATKLNGKGLENLDPPYLNIIPQSIVDKVRFVVLTSAGGGTGSGSFIDLGFFLRRLGENKRAAKHMDLIGHALLARVEANPNQVRNSAALLTELDLYQVREGRVYQGHYLNLSGSPWENKQGYKPYDCCYVVMPQQQLKVLGGSDPFTTLQAKVADYLLCDTISTFEDDVPAEKVKSPRFGPVGVEAFKGDFGLNPPGLQTYGVSRREWPAAQVHRQLYSSKLKRLAERWCGVQETTLFTLMGKLRGFCGLPADAEKKPPRRPSEDALFSRLCAAIDQDNSAKRLIEGARLKVVDSKRNSLKPGALDELLSELKGLFSEQRDADPRSVIGVIRKNTQSLIDPKSEQSLMQLVGLELLSHAFTAQGGAATVAEACRKLRGELKLEREYIAEGLETVSPRIGDIGITLRQCHQFANDSLLCLVLTAKEKVLFSLEEWILKLETRFTHLQEYLTAWKGAITYDSTDLKGESVVVPSSFLEKFSRQLPDELDLERLTSGLDGRTGLATEFQSLIRLGLPETNGVGEPTLFFRDYPRKRGQPDFSFMAPIEASVFREVERLPSGPYQQQIFSVILEWVREQKADAFPRLMAEAEFLIHADIGATDFSALHFGGNPMHLSLIYQADQKDTNEFQRVCSEQDTWLRGWSPLGQLKTVPVHDKVTDRLSPYTVDIIAERCALPSEFIVGYDLERRREWFNRDPFPALTDKRIVIPPGKEQIKRARMLFLASVVLQMWRYEGGKDRLHRLEYRSPRTDGTVEPLQFQVKSEYADAIELLAGRKDVMDALERKLRDYLKVNEGLAIELFIENLNSMRQKIAEETGIRGNLDNLNLRNVLLSEAYDALHRFAADFHINLPKDQHPFAVFVPQGGPVPVTGKASAHEGWYCKQCGHRQGSQEPPWVGDDAHCQSEDCRYPHSTNRLGGRA